MADESSTKQRFDTAYGTLEGEINIPARLSKSYIRFFNKVGKSGNKCPTSIKLLQFKLELDAHLDGVAEMIYKKLKLN